MNGLQTYLNTGMNYVVHAKKTAEQYNLYNGETAILNYMTCISLFQEYAYHDTQGASLSLAIGIVGHVAGYTATPVDDIAIALLAGTNIYLNFSKFTE